MTLTALQQFSLALGQVAMLPSVNVSPAGFVIRPVAGTPLSALADAAVPGLAPLVQANSSIRGPRVLLNVQAWPQPTVPSSELRHQLTQLSDQHGMTVALKWRDEQGPQAEEFEPQARRLYQAGLQMMAVESDDSEILKILQQLDWKTEWEVAKTLVAIGEPAVEPLIQWLADDSQKRRKSSASHELRRTEQSRRFVIIVLGRIGDARAVEPLLTQLVVPTAAHDPKEVPGSALVKIGEPAVEPLLSLLSGFDVYGQFHFSVDTRGRWTSDESYRRETWKAYIRGLDGGRFAGMDPFYERDDYVRGAVMDVLSEIADARAVEPLLAQLSVHNTKFRGRVVQLLGQLGDARAVKPLLAQLVEVEPKFPSHYDMAFIESIRDALAAIGEPAVEPLLAQLSSKKEYVRVRVVETLGEIGDERDFEPLIACLADEKAAVRLAAVEALARYNDTRVVKPLIKCLKDSHHQVRARAASVLGQLGDTRAVRPLIAQLSDQNKEVRKAVVNALAQLGDALAVPPLIEQLSDKDEEVRKAVIEALAKLGDTGAVEPLIAQLKSSPNLRQAVIYALEELGDTRAVAPLLALLPTKNREVQSSIRSALGKLGDARAVPVLMIDLSHEEYRVRRDAGHALSEIGEAAVEPLLACIGEARSLLPLSWDRSDYHSAETADLVFVEATVRSIAIQLLAQIGAPAFERLIARLSDEEAAVRAEAAQLLEKIGAPAVRPLLQRLMGPMWVDAEVKE